MSGTSGPAGRWRAQGLLPLFRWGAAPDQNIGAEVSTVWPDYGSTFDAYLPKGRRILSEGLEDGADKKA